MQRLLLALLLMSYACAQHLMNTNAGIRLVSYPPLEGPQEPVFCLNECVPPGEDLFEVSVKWTDAPVDKCAGAKYDRAQLTKEQRAPGKRYTGVYYKEWRGGNCEVKEDPRCPASYTYFGMLRYGCTERNGTLYYNTHTWEDLHNLLTSVDVKNMRRDASFDRD
jgi:hypothetical protein